MRELEHKDLVSMSPEEKQYFEHQLLVHYDIAVGLFLFEASLEKYTFCKLAEDHRKAGNELYTYWK